MRYLLDTNIVSALMKAPSGDAAIRLSAVQPDEVCTSIVVLAEVLYGIEKSGSARLAKQFSQIAPTLNVLGLEHPAEEYYARMRNETESSGLTVSQNDLLIAAHARSLDAVLVTGDRIFLSIPELKVENWLQPQS